MRLYHVKAMAFCVYVHYKGACVIQDKKQQRKRALERRDRIAQDERKRLSYSP